MEKRPLLIVGALQKSSEVRATLVGKTSPYYEASATSIERGDQLHLDLGQKRFEPIIVIDDNLVEVSSRVRKILSSFNYAAQIFDLQPNDLPDLIRIVESRPDSEMPVEFGHGRIRNPAHYVQMEKEFNDKYGKGQWERGFFYENHFYPYLDSVDLLYNVSYTLFLEENPDLVAGLLKSARWIYNSHAQRTGGVDLQVPAIHNFLVSRGLNLNGNSPIDIGDMKKNTLGNLLGPDKVPFLGGKNGKISLEEFWQSPFHRCVILKEEKELES